MELLHREILTNSMEFRGYLDGDGIKNAGESGFATIVVQNYWRFVCLSCWDSV
jgi:hypothetical protein